MRKKILFTCLRMNVGGVEKAMLSLIRALGPDFDIHLALMAPEGGFMGQIPSWVTVHEIGGFSRQQQLWLHPIKEILKRLLTFRWRTGIPAAWYYAKSQLTHTLFHYSKWLLKDNHPGARFANPDLDGEFDMAIDFPGLPGESLGYYVANHVKAKRRVSWIHFDLDRIFIRPKSCDEMYGKMDRIYIVSEKAYKQFCSRWPEYASKARVFHNIVDPTDIIAKSLEPLPIPLASPTASSLTSEGESQSEKIVNIVTVGRTMHEKGPDMALRALRNLLDRGQTNLFWHFIGGGEQLEDYRAMAKELGVEKHCHFYGALTNPYPYMRMADVYVQPSRHEGYGITVAEAKLFGMPIVATNFLAAAEQLSPRSNAIIIPNFTTEDSSEIAALSDAIQRATTLPRVPSATGATTPPEATTTDPSALTSAPLGEVSAELADFLALL